MTYPTMSFDVETHALANLKVVGAAKYLNDLDTDVALFAYHPLNSTDTPKVWYPWDKPPGDLIDHVLSGGLLSGWNVLHFDRVAWEVILVRRFGFPSIPSNQWADSMFLAAAANLPRSLDGCAKAVGVPYVGDLKDNNILRRITNKKMTPKIEGADLEWLTNRCRQDTIMEEETLRRLPPWPDMFPWNRIREVDRAINERGVLMDVELVRGLEKAAGEETLRIDAEIRKLTDGAVPKGSQIEKLKAWLVSQGVPVPLKDAVEEEDEEEGESNEVPEKETAKKTAYRLRKSDIADILALSDLSDNCRLALEYRAEIAKASVKKLKRMLADMGEDGRLRGAFVLGGAQQTMRWCLSEDSRILVKTLCGNVVEKLIATVSITDLVWDGWKWVSHEGVVYSGEKNVISYDNVVATEEHEVYISEDERVPLWYAKQHCIPLFEGASCPPVTTKSIK